MLFLREQMTTDTHPADQFRPATVRNLDAWYAAFDVKPGDKLYLAPVDRVRIWYANTGAGVALFQQKVDP